ATNDQDGPAHRDGGDHRRGRRKGHPPEEEGARRAPAGPGSPGKRLRKEDRVQRARVRQDDGRGEQGFAVVHTPRRRTGGQGREAHWFHYRRRRQGVPRRGGGDQRRQRDRVVQGGPEPGGGALRVGEFPGGQSLEQGGLTRVAVPHRRLPEDA